MRSSRIHSDAIGGLKRILHARNSFWMRKHGARCALRRLQPSCYKSGNCAMTHPIHVPCINQVFAAWEDGAARYPPNLVDHVYGITTRAPSKVQGSRNDGANGSAGSQTAPRRLVLGQRIALVPSLVGRKMPNAPVATNHDDIQLTLGDRLPVTWSDQGIAARN